MNHTLTLSPYGEKIFLDRYSRKDPASSIPIGSRVLYTDPDTRQKEAGLTVLVDGNQVHVQADNGNQLVFRREELDHPLEDVGQTLERVAQAAAGKDEQLLERFRAILHNKRFIPAGRILESLGSGRSTTGVNCFVLPCPHDSREGIFTSLRQMAELMCKGGGVGINYSSLRPANAYVAGVNGRSSGAVSWMEMFSHVTNLIIQGGSRRGAQMAMMAVWHPDVREFINLKRDNARATGCNMSVIVSDEFMAAVDAGEDWVLKFPDTSHADYNQEWDGDLGAWEAKGLPVVAWSRLPAKDLWDSICSSAHACAEPGIWFQDQANSARPSGGRLIATNPCGEQGLPAYSVCNLGHIYLPAFLVGNAWDALGDTYLDVNALDAAVRSGVRFLDRVVDETKYPLSETARQQMLERRVGLGTLGLGEYLIRRGVRYGSGAALKECRTIYRHIAYAAYDESATLATEHGPAPNWNPDQFVSSTFGRRLEKEFPELHERVRRFGLRNVTLLTQAPTGTTGTMLGTSSGIEPYYLLEWKRKSRLGMHVERATPVEEYRAYKPDGDLPSYFVTANDLSAFEHVAMQAAIQEWTDASISKTINLPREATVQDVEDAYRTLYTLGCKGGTVYRDGSRDVQVLAAVDEPKPEKKTFKAAAVPSVRPSMTSSRQTPGGKVHVHLTVDHDGQPLEVFCDSGRSGSETHALMEAMGRLASLVLRVDDSMSPSARLEAVVSQLRGIGGSNSVGLGPNRVLSIADGVALALWDAWSAVVPQPSAPVALGLDLCPQCQNTTLQKASGCENCLNCDYSRC